jgi:hypothetical protein
MFRIVRPSSSRKSAFFAAVTGMWLVCAAGCGTTPVIEGTGDVSGGTDASFGDAVTDQDTIGADDTGDASTDNNDVISGDLVPTDGDTSGSTDGSSGSDTVSPKDGDAGPIVDEYKELLIKVLGPSGRDWAQNEGASAALSGVAWGHPEKIEWAAGNGSKGVVCGAGSAQPVCDEFWQSDILTLDQGDNAITVTATKGAQTASDTIHITYNPLFSFDGAPNISPNAIFVGESATLVVGMSVPGAAGSSVVDASSITLIEVDADGKTIKEYGTLQDNGNAGNCDDAQKDSVYSTCLSLNAPTAKTFRFRVRASVSVKLSGSTVTKYQALSPVAEVDAVNHFTPTECLAVSGLQQKTAAAYKTAVAAGTDAGTALAAAIAALQGDASVAEAGTTEGGNVWIRYKSGRLGALNLASKGLRGAGGPPAGDGAALPTHSVGTRRALSLAPFASEFAASGGDEAAQSAAALNAKQCPPFAVDAYADNAALLKYYRQMSSYGIVALSGHGDNLFLDMDVAAKQALSWEHLGSQEVVWSGEAVDCNALSASSGTCSQTSTGCKATETCVKTSMSGGICVDYTQADVMTGRVVIGDSSYGFLPGFVRRHSPDKFPGSIVYLGACRSMYNGSMALQFIAAGAAAVIGYSDYVTANYAYEKGWGMFDGVINGGLSVLQGIVPGDDPAHPGARLRMYGDSAANAKDQNLINPSWDSGKVTGWKPVGDGRVVSRLGETVPVAGKFMGIISTGLGFTTENGSLEQPFCVDKNKQNLCFFWKFYSEEFIEYCGSSYMDQFRATLTADSGQITMTDVWIDQLCPYDCGGKSACDPGSAACKCGQQWKTLTQADVSFDQGGVWMTPWQKTCTDVSGLSGVDKKVNLKFFATDKGDSIFDTVILLDEVTVD